MIEKLNQINEISLDDVSYKIVFHAGGDLKWLANCFGINAANSLYPCVWCTWKMKNKLNIEDTEINFPISRNHKEALSCSKKKDMDEKKGYLNKAIFPFISFDKVVVDILHLTLRITDKLFQLLLDRLQQLDGNDSSDFNKRSATNVFRKYIINECKITSPFYIKKVNNESKTKLRKLNQNERIKIINKICDQEQKTTLADIFDLKNHKEDKSILKLSHLFSEFSEITKIIKNLHQDINMDDLKKKLRDWLKLFIQIDEKITPYIHVFCFHLPDFIEKFSSLNLFSMQGLEKSNHIAKIYFHRQTNHHKSAFTKILLEKINRKEYIHLKGMLEV